MKFSAKQNFQLIWNGIGHKPLLSIDFRCGAVNVVLGMHLSQTRLPYVEAAPGSQLQKATNLSTTLVVSSPMTAPQLKHHLRNPFGGVWHRINKQSSMTKPHCPNMRQKYNLILYLLLQRLDVGVEINTNLSLPL